VCRAATRCNTLQHAATRCNTLQHTATGNSGAQVAQHHGTQNAHCNTQQHTATHYNRQYWRARGAAPWHTKYTLQHTATGNTGA